MNEEKALADTVTSRIAQLKAQIDKAEKAKVAAEKKTKDMGG